MLKENKFIKLLFNAKKSTPSSESIDKLQLDTKSTSESADWRRPSAASVPKSSSSESLATSTEALDEFKDFDPNSEEKLFGIDLFDELPIHERRMRFEETVT